MPPELRRKCLGFVRPSRNLRRTDPHGLRRFFAMAGSAIFLATCSLLVNASDESDVLVAPLVDGALHIHVHAKVQAPREVIWNTLTDYDHFGQFVPGLRVSHVVSCQDGDCVVEQKWRIPVLWLSVPISVTVLSLERPPSTLGVHLLGGDLNRLDGAYEIGAARDGPVDLRWDGLLKGPVYLPRWISAHIVRKLARAQFRGMVAEIEQRASALNSPRRESLLIGSVP